MTGEENVGKCVLQGRRVVVVGGGIIGASIAFHLSERGYGDVVVLEKGRVGEGATAYATGGIRQQFTSRVNAELAHRSLPFWRDFGERTGQPFAFREHGYMFLLSSADMEDTFSAAVEMQRSIGIDVQLLAPDQVADVFPGVRVDDVRGATYCRSDGSGSPSDAVAGFVSAARARGVVFRQHSEVVGLTYGSEGAVSGVLTADGSPVEAELVVLACGPQSRALGQRCGIDVPVSPRRRQAFSTGRLDWLHAHMPLTVDLGSGAYIHPEVAGTAVVGGSDRDVAEGTDTSVDWGLLQPLIEALVHRFPAMADASVLGGWAGLREMSPDDHAIVGPVEGMPGLWVATGFSGHGFMHSPAIGECLAARWLDGVSPLDLGELRPSRFAERSLVPEGLKF